MNKKGDVIEVDITDFSTDGEGIGKTDAFTWFIKDSVIGDRVRAVVMKTQKSYGYARVVEILKVQWLDHVVAVHCRVYLIVHNLHLSKIKSSIT